MNNAPKIELDIGFRCGAIDESLQSELTVRFENAAAWVAERFSLNSLTVSISVVDDPTIHRLNREHLQHDWPTDVISFSFDPGPDASGEVIASWDTASRLSSAARWHAADELVLYVVHGMLHVVGLDDIEPDDMAQMRQVEHQYLLDAGVPGAENYLDRFDDVSY
jgi:probable rRNA maturation factor